MTWFRYFYVKIINLKWEVDNLEEFTLFSIGNKVNK